ncbi:MAG: DEAD/DEAH box helicase [Bdellovibrio sp.]|nr:DEAD/DEAH box helicase [Bdellovibrio sp.]
MTVSNRMKKISSLANENALTRDQATLYSDAVRKSWGATGIGSWTENRSTLQLHDAIRLLAAAESFKSEGNRQQELACYRRAGDILEWLSRSKHVEHVPLRFIAACAFTLAECPAMAFGVLSKTDDEAIESPAFLSFLKADFNGALDHVLTYWNEGDDEGDEDGQQVIVQELLRVIGLIAYSLKTNNKDRFELARRKLNGLTKYALQFGSDYSWLLFELTCKVVDKFEEKSAWKLITPLRENSNEAGHRAFESYCKNLFKNGQGMLWPSQEAGLLKLAEESSFAMCTPTGSGKTTVAEVALIQSSFTRDDDMQNDDFLYANPGSLSMYIVPSRALANEVETRLAKSIGGKNIGISVVGLYGGTDLGLSDLWVNEDAPTVLVLTVEKAESIVRHLGSAIVKRLSLVIIDEAHQIHIDSVGNKENLINSDNRSARLEAFTARVRLLNKKCRLIALSAVAGGAEELIAMWAEGTNEALPVGGKYRSTRQLIGSLECYGDGTAKVQLDILNGQKLELVASKTDAYIPLSFPSLPKLTGALKSSAYSFVECHSLWMAIHLGLAGKQVLISVTQNIDSIMKHYCDLFEAQKNWQKKVPVFFDRNNLSEDSKDLYDRCITICDDYCGKGSFERRLLGFGIAVHHGQLPIKLRRSMTDLIRSGCMPVTVATSTLTEGVNLGFDVILLPKIRRSRHLREENRHEWFNISTAEFMNLAGRAGRPGTQAEGMTLVALPIDVASAQGTAAAKKQKAQIKTARTSFNSLIKDLTSQVPVANHGSPLGILIDLIWEQWRAISNSNDPVQFYKWLELINPTTIDWNDLSPQRKRIYSAVDSLDQFLVSAIEELESLEERELDTVELESELKELWSKCYARVAAGNEDLCKSIFLKRGMSIPTRIYEQRSARKKLYLSGMPPRNTAEFLTLLPSLQQLLIEGKDFGVWSRKQRFNYLCSIVSILQSLSFIKIANEDNLDWKDIFSWWLQFNKTDPAPEILNEWLHFCSKFFEFKIGMAIGAALTLNWNEINSNNPRVDLDNWSEESQLPWASFWLKEMIIWGTIEPLAAFLMSSGKVESRGEAEAYVEAYDQWLSQEVDDIESNERLSLKNFKLWLKSEFEVEKKKRRRVQTEVEIGWQRFGVDEVREFHVLPHVSSKHILWFDAAGYLLATTEVPEGWHKVSHKDFEFVLDASRRTIRRSRISA